MNRLASALALAITLTAAFAVFSPGMSRADDWPQWMGPQRDNVWRESGLFEKFPAGGPPVAWRTAVAYGYAGPAVAEGRVYLMDFVCESDLNVDNFARKEFAGTERVLCLDEKTGDVKWKHE